GTIGRWSLSCGRRLYAPERRSTFPSPRAERSGANCFLREEGVLARRGCACLEAVLHAPGVLGEQHAPELFQFPRSVVEDIQDGVPVIDRQCDLARAGGERVVETFSCANVDLGPE